MEIKRNFSNFASCVLIIKLLFIILPIFTNIMVLVGGYGGYMDLVMLIYMLLFFCFAIPTLMKIRFGLIGLCIVFVAKFIFGVPWGSELAAYTLGEQTGSSVFEILFFISLCIKKNGISGWVYMLASKEHLKSLISLEESSEEKNS